MEYEKILGYVSQSCCASVSEKIAGYVSQSSCSASVSEESSEGITGYISQSCCASISKQEKKTNSKLEKVSLSEPITNEDLIKLRELF
jgi:hypothetical protein